MIIEYVKRYAENINIKNDIYDFNNVFPFMENISAISWELPHHSRREYGEMLFKKMYSTVTNNKINTHIMVQLVPEQPNTAMVNYKKTWGLIESSGVNVNDFYDKKSFIDNGINGLILTGAGNVSNDLQYELQKLINSEEKLFFSNQAPNFNFDDKSHPNRLTGWICNILYNGGVVFFLLGRFDEIDAEVVAIGKECALEKIR